MYLQGLLKRNGVPPHLREEGSPVSLQWFCRGRAWAAELGRGLPAPLCHRPGTRLTAGATQGSCAPTSTSPPIKRDFAKQAPWRLSYIILISLRNCTGIPKIVLQCSLLKIRLQGLGRGLSVWSSTGYYLTLNYLFTLSGKKNYCWCLLRTTGWGRGVCVKGVWLLRKEAVRKRKGWHDAF